MIKDTLIAVETALKEIPELKYINEDWGQIDYYPQPPVLWPCVLLECEGVDYTALPSNLQQGEGAISVRVADLRNMQQANAKSTSAEPRYSFFELLDKVHKALQGLSGETFTSLNRKTMRRTRRDDAVREFVLTYKFTFKDATAVKAQFHKIAPPIVTVGIKNSDPV